MIQIAGNFDIRSDKNIEPAELANLWASVGWGREADLDARQLQHPLPAYPLTAHCRTRNGTLVGYVRAFSDGAFFTFIGELAVRPGFQGRGIGSALLAQIGARCAGVPLYAATFDDTREFFIRSGFRVPSRPMSVVSTRKDL